MRRHAGTARWTSNRLRTCWLGVRISLPAPCPGSSEEERHLAEVKVAGSNPARDAQHAVEAHEDEHCVGSAEVVRSDRIVGSTSSQLEGSSNLFLPGRMHVRSVPKTPWKWNQSGLWTRLLTDGRLCRGDHAFPLPLTEVMPTPRHPALKAGMQEEAR